MARKKLLDDIKQNPPRIYRAPGDVLRDRRFDDSERLEILCAWRDASDAQTGAAGEIGAMILEVEHRLLPAEQHAR